ncbi:hypothetical protein KO498_15785 [Lentibacter algarum]|uniref:hypothetical protein n=1 Tax=Lentibacter algarum TaxID=576131 RepID=UPI001C08E489|nr:hypothetical protein [Lentibacter algarum]MBU2983268.1 hypothetical protein [Lentibacter algarum]
MSLAVGFRQKAAVLWHTQRIKRVVREIGGLGPHTLVSVAEITCDDPACPGPVTQITILGLDLRRNVLVVHRPAAEVAAANLQMFSR